VCVCVYTDEREGLCWSALSLSSGLADTAISPFSVPEWRGAVDHVPHQAAPVMACGAAAVRLFYTLE